MSILNGPKPTRITLGRAGGGFSAARETGSALPGAGKPERTRLLLLEVGPSRDQRDCKLAAALDIFSELNMPRERDQVRAELEKTAAAERAP